MPEIAEVTRVVHFIRTHLKGRRIAKILVQDDANVYGKVGTTAAEFQKSLTGRTILDAKQQGKYFWLEMDKPPHPLAHFGMTGWWHLSNIETGYYRSKAKRGSEKSSKGLGDDDEKDIPEAVYNNAGSTTDDEQEWPPRFWKFVLQMEGEPHVEAAFVDSRRFGRIRLVNVPADQMRKTTPLKENGPDPVQDRSVLTEEWFIEKLKNKRVPVKALLLDQAFISGVGNWVGDEILYNAKIHPEQYSNTLNDKQCKQLYKSLMYVCTTACDLLGDSDKFPSDWIFKHRWSKGKKDANVMPSGEKIAHVTVGGRTSAIVPSVQKKTGPVAADIDGEDDVKEESKGSQKKATGTEKKSSSKSTSQVPKQETPKAQTTPSSKRKRKDERPDLDGDKRAASSKKAKTSDAPKDIGSRRSTRIRK